jgi:hypothetical protein
MEDTEETRRIWSIRDHIDKVEEVKDEIVNLPGMDAMWIVDAKDIYFHLVAAWQLLKSCPRLEVTDLLERVDNVQAYSEMAKEKCLQVTSELDALKDSSADDLSKKLASSFKHAVDAIDTSLQTYLPVAEEIPPTKLIEKVGETDYLIHCAICGESTAVFAVGEKDDGTKGILFQGITGGRTFEYELNTKLLEHLANESLKDVHEYLKNNTFLEDGMDSYCPECDVTYCRKHYSLQVVYDEGFYDCTYGTCPKGHRRIIDD